MIDILIKNKLFSDRMLLRNFHIKVCKGSFTVVTGPSGSGKSTLLNIIGLLDTDFNGEYVFDNTILSLSDKKHMHQLRKKYFGYVFQDSLINEKQSIKRNLMCAVDYNEQNQVSINMRNVLDMVGLNDLSRQTSVLSGGEKQRLSLARALIKEPTILLADEPTASLDLKNKKNIMNILFEYNKKGGTVIMITHDLELIDKKTWKL